MLEVMALDCIRAGTFLSAQYDIHCIKLILIRHGK